MYWITLSIWMSLCPHFAGVVSVTVNWLLVEVEFKGIGGDIKSETDTQSMENNNEIEEIRVRMIAMSSQESQKSEDETTETSTATNLRRRIIPTTDTKHFGAKELMTLPTSSPSIDAGKANTTESAAYEMATYAARKIVIAASVVVLVVASAYISGSTIAGVVVAMVVGLLGLPVKVAEHEAHQSQTLLNKKALEVQETHLEILTRGQELFNADDLQMPNSPSQEKGNQQVDAQIAELRAEQLKMKQQLASLTSEKNLQRRVEDGSNLALTYITDGAMADGQTLTSDKVEQQDVRQREQHGDMNQESEQIAAEAPVVDETIAVSDEVISNIEEQGELPDVCPDADGVNVDLDYSVYEELEERLHRLCIEHDVEVFLIHQNPVDFTDIVIVGVNATKILKEEFDDVNKEKEQWADFKIHAEEPDEDEDEIELLVNSKIRGTTLARLNGTCEMLVTASVRSTENNPQIAEYAVGPAHMMFSDETNKRLQKGEGLAEAHRFIEMNPPHTKYEIHFGPDEEQMAVIDTHHPPLISYRYICTGQDIPILSGSHPDDYLSETSVPTEDDTEVNCKHYLNDMVLLRLGSNEARRLHTGLTWHGGREVQLVNVDSANDLKKYTRPDERSVRIPIEVKEQRGFLVKNSLSVAEQRKRGEPYHLRFKLLTNGQLVAGDSGSIVFEVVNNQELRPLGMLTCRDRKVPKSFGSIYQAVILSSAFKDISTECTPDVEHIRPYN